MDSSAWEVRITRRGALVDYATFKDRGEAIQWAYEQERSGRGVAQVQLYKPEVK